jgi:radical SAM superfamily enzyme YgiQ (UPF0313 family)
MAEPAREPTKVFLIYPPTGLMNREDRCQVPTKDVVIAPPLPPTDLMYMAAAAEEAGSTCRIVDYTLDGLTMERLLGDLEEFRPDFLLISTTTPTINLDLKACSAAKRALPGVRTVAKGAHFLRFNAEVLDEHPDLDFIIRGEPEITLRELVTGRRAEDIPGLTWRGPSRAVNNPPRPFLEDLDSLPFPARHLVDNARYVRPDNGRVQGIIKVARGCPFNCFFCLATPVSGRKVRKRSPKNILDEVRLCIEKYGMRDFIFWSDIFNLDRQWVMELCEEILRSGLEFTWATNTRTDTIDLEMALLLKKAGCTLLSIGIESGSQEVLLKMGKKTDLDGIRETFRILRKAGLRTFAYYIIGLPWDTRETVEETIRLAIELDSDYANFFTATAFPGTRFFEYALENGLFGEEDEGQEELFRDAYFYPTVRGHYLGKDEIADLHKEAVRRFFFRPGYILRTLLKVRSPRELYNYCKGALGLFKH